MKKYDEILRVLRILKYTGPVSVTMIQRELKMGNWYAAKLALNYLKEKGLVVEEYDPGPPGRYVYKLTEKGKKAADLAEQLLELLES